MKQLKGKVSIILFIFTLMIFFSEYSLSMELPKKGKEYYYDEVGILSEESINEIEKINKEEVFNKNNNIKIFLNVNIKSPIIFKKIEEIQKKLKNNIERVTMMNVYKIDIYINRIEEKR